MNFVLRQIDRSSRFAETLAVIALFGYCALMLAEVFSRGFLGSSIAQAWEYGSFAMGAVFFLAAGRGIRTGTHVRVSLILEGTSPRVSRLFDILANLAAIMLAILITHALWTVVLAAYQSGRTSTSILRTPLFYPQMLLFFGAAQLVLDLIARLIRLLRYEKTDLTGADAHLERSDSGEANA